MAEGLKVSTALSEVWSSTFNTMWPFTTTIIVVTWDLIPSCGVQTLHPYTLYKRLIK